MTEFESLLLEHIPTAISVVTDDGRIVYGNRAFKDTFGPGADVWIQSGARAIAGERGWLQSFFAGGHEEHELEVDHEGRTYHVTQIRLGSRADQTDRVALSFEDITRQREIEQAKSDFTSMIVHDLRGPLSGIQGTLEFILDGKDSKLSSLQTELLEESKRESERMMHLVDELLDFSKIESGNFEVSNDPVQVASMLKRSVRSLQQAAARDGVYLLSAHGFDLPLAQGNAEKLTQVVINLLSNALKFTPTKGVISVGARIIRDEEGGATLLVSVTDTGIGIKPEAQGRLFQKYKQTEGKSFRGGSGTGLGLYIVKQVVEAHGGNVTLSSIEGVGTSMMFTLPLVTRPARAAS
jgi:two-component system, OmpR family, phosphate regulon sensor histidine kinase PhoR